MSRLPFPRLMFAFTVGIALAITGGCDSTPANPGTISNPENVSAPVDAPISADSNESAKSNVPAETNKPDGPSTAKMDKPNDASTSARLEAPEDSSFSIRFLSWNIESDGAVATTIAPQLKEMVDGHDVVALCEVLPPDATGYKNVLGDKYVSILSYTGRSDRLQILFNSERFELIRKLELHEINYDRYRSPLVVQLKDRGTGQQFMVMNNHLARGKADIRQKQAADLVEFARKQTVPIIALGDYNLDYVFETDKGNEAFNVILRDNVFSWVRPAPLIDTNWYDEAGDGEDDYPGSMLDFAFVSGAAKSWNPQCRVIVRDGDFPDDELTSDHRPFELLISK